MILPKEQQTLLLLTQLTQELKKLALWQEFPPSIDKMSSKLPFHYDTLTFEQWLQFVFIENIRSMIDKDQTLPRNMSLLPMAEESFKKCGNKAEKLLSIINQLDCVFSGRKV